jgi:hypothetical protein
VIGQNLQSALSAVAHKVQAIRPIANRTPANALSRVAPLVLLGLAELEVVVPMVDGLEAAVGETDEADEEAEEADDAVRVEAVVPEAEAVVPEAEAVVPKAEAVVPKAEAVVPKAEAEAEDVFWMSMVKAESPVYDCTVLSPDVVVVRSSLDMVKVPVSDSMTELTVKTNPPSSDLATEMVYVPHWVCPTAGSSPLLLAPIASQLSLNSGLLLVAMVIS